MQVAFFLGLQVFAFGQVGKSMIGSYIASIPNPNSVVSIVGFLSNKSVAKEIKLTDQAMKELTELKEASGGIISSPRISFRGRMPSSEEVAGIEAALTAKLADNNRRVREILSESQIARLMQLVHQIEIAKVGFAEALTDGYFGKAIGVEDYQKPALKIRAESIEKKVARELMEMFSVAINEVVVDLQAVQLRDLKSLLGSEFVFRDVQAEASRRIHRKQNG